MKKIHKYEVKYHGPPVMLPEGAIILSAGLQVCSSGLAESVYVWALVDESKPREPRILTWYYTGREVPEPLKFIGTLQCRAGKHLHVVELLVGRRTSDE